MKLRDTLARWLLAFVFLVGPVSVPVRADVLPPRPRPEPTPPKPQPPLPPDPQPIPDDDGESLLRSVVIAGTAASVGVTLLGVWMIRRQLRRPVSNTSAATT